MWNLFHFAATQIVASVFDMAVDNLLRDGAVHPIGFAHMPTTHYPADFYPVKDDEERHARMRANAVGGAFMVGAISEAWSIDQEALETELGAAAAQQVVLECVRPSQSPYRVEAVNVQAEVWPLSALCDHDRLLPPGHGWLTAAAIQSADACHVRRTRAWRPTHARGRHTFISRGIPGHGQRDGNRAGAGAKGGVARDAAARELGRRH